MGLQLNHQDSTQTISDTSYFKRYRSQYVTSDLTAPDGEALWMKTQQHLPLFREVQAALEVLVLPTQEKCKKLQPNQAKPPLLALSLEKTSSTTKGFTHCPLHH